MFAQHTTIYHLTAVYRRWWMYDGIPYQIKQRAGDRGITHTRLTALSTGLPRTALSMGLPRWAGTRKVKPIWILLKQETVSGSGICWTICKAAPCSRQTTMPAPHHSVYYRPDALPVAQPTVSKHWRQGSYWPLHHKATQVQSTSSSNQHLLALRSRVCETSQLLMNSCGFLAKPRKKSRFVLSWLIVSTVSWICRNTSASLVTANCILQALGCKHHYFAIHFLCLVLIT